HQPHNGDATMAKPSTGSRKNGNSRKATAAKSRNVASLDLARRGVSSSEGFRNLMCSMMTDVIQGKISPDVVNAACNAGRGLLRMIEMEYRATASRGNGKRSLPVSRRIGHIATG